jgi:hypothetical protein
MDLSISWEPPLSATDQHLVDGNVNCSRQVSTLIHEVNTVQTEIRVLEHILNLTK